MPATDALLRHLHVSDDDHVLVIGEDTFDLMCALLRRGCGAVMATRAQEAVRPDPVELVVVADVASLPSARAALALARRALSPQVGSGGRIVVSLAATAPRALARAVAAALREQGFGRLRQAEAGPAPVLTAELPCFWTPRPADGAAACAA